MLRILCLQGPQPSATPGTSFVEDTFSTQGPGQGDGFRDDSHDMLHNLHHHQGQSLYLLLFAKEIEVKYNKHTKSAVVFKPKIYIRANKINFRIFLLIREKALGITMPLQEL